jgi:hypothetical protein
LRQREIGERAAPRTKRGHDTRLEWAPLARAMFCLMIYSGSTRGKECPFQGTEGFDSKATFKVGLMIGREA